MWRVRPTRGNGCWVWMPRDPVVLVGVSTRALAESAVRAGYSCVSVDAFGDLDQKHRLPNLGIRRDLGERYTAARAVQVARRLTAGPAAYVGNLENHPRAVQRLAAGRRLLGNAPATLIRARTPETLVEAAGGLARVPTTLRRDRVAGADPGRRWLRKPARGGGGSGVSAWRPGEPLGRREIVQERMDGTTGSILFLAGPHGSVLLGLSEILSGASAPAAPGYRYGGSLYPLEPPREETGSALRSLAQTLAASLTDRLGLRGINGADFVLRDGCIHLLEVNPRCTASAELVERATGLSIFAAHVAACGGERVPPPIDPVGSWGKAIVYADADVVVGDTSRWLDREDRRDIPFPGERIARGQPVCTVFARGRDRQECLAGLERAVAEVRRELSAGAKGDARDG